MNDKQKNLKKNKQVHKANDKNKMKKILIKLATNLVLDVLMEYAKKQHETGGTSEEHHQRWNIIIQFLWEMRGKGIPF